MSTKSLCDIWALRNLTIGRPRTHCEFAFLSVARSTRHGVFGAAIYRYHQVAGPFCDSHRWMERDILQNPFTSQKTKFPSGFPYGKPKTFHTFPGTFLSQFYESILIDEIHAIQITKTLPASPLFSRPRENQRAKMKWKFIFVALCSRTLLFLQYLRAPTDPFLVEVGAPYRSIFFSCRFVLL